MKQSRKIQVLVQVQAAIGRGEQPKPPAVGLTEREFEEMADEELFELRYSVSIPEPTWSDYSIVDLTDKARGLIASFGPLPESRAAKRVRVLGIGLWDLVKIPISLYIGYLFGKHFH
jgi:hypothetical protein